MPKKLPIPPQPLAPVSRQSDKIMLRLPDGLRDLLLAEAAKNRRSMNSEAVARLQDSFDPTKANVVVDLELLKRFNTIVEELEAIKPGLIIKKTAKRQSKS